MKKTIFRIQLRTDGLAKVPPVKITLDSRKMPWTAKNANTRGQERILEFIYEAASVFECHQIQIASLVECAPAHEA